MQCLSKKSLLTTTVIGLLGMVACSKFGKDVVDGVERTVQQEPFSIQFPSPESEIPSVVLTTDQSALVSAADRFAFMALKEIYSDDKSDKSLVFSPLSLQYALGMLANGASKADAEEISSVLGYDGDLGRLNEFSKSLIEQLPAVDLNVELVLSDALIVDEQYPVMSAYKQTIGQYYYSSVENLPFGDSEYVKSVVNGWCDKNTKGMIPTLLDKVDPSSIAYLLNALYFKGLWTDQYDPEYMVVKDAVFHGLNGDEPVDYLFDCLYYLYAERDGYRVVRKPFGNGKYGFYILLPDEDSNVETLMSTIAGEKWEQICASLERREVSLRIPKYELSSSFSLIDHLKAIGIRRVFSSSAVLSGMFENPGEIQVSGVIQKNRISVDEVGIKVASVTEVELLSGSTGEDDPEPVYFWADRPFVFVIAEETSGAILFNGVFSGR